VMMLMIVPPRVRHVLSPARLHGTLGDSGLMYMAAPFK
jgi:hypothetical protein